MAQDMQSLFLQVDASVELLRRNLAAGEAPLSRFEQRAGRMADNVDRRVGEMGKYFPQLAKMAESAADRIEKSFNDSFNQVQRAAAKAIQLNVTPSGGLDIGAGDARAAAETARQRAAALKLIEQAAQRAAAGEGELTRETRTYLQAASAARIEAEQQATDLLRQAGALERLEIELRQAGTAQQVFDSQQQRSRAITGQTRAGLQQLSFQANDIAVQFAAGTPPMIIFAQQSGQVIQALQLMGGEAKGFLGFLAGPWGLALTTAVVALSPFVGKLLEGEDATKKIDKAQRSFVDVLSDSKSSWEEVTKAAQDYAEQQKKNREQTLLDIQVEAQAIASRLKSAIATREKLQADLESLAVAQKLREAQGIGDPLSESGLAQANLGSREGSVEAQLRKNKEALAGLQADAGAVVIKTADAIAKVRSDPTEQVREGFRLLRKEARDSIKDVNALAARLTELDRREARAVEQLQQLKSASNRNDARDTAQFGSPVSGGRATGNFGESRPGHAHGGIDYAVPVGTVVRAVADGIVKFVGQKGNYGNVVDVDAGGPIVRDAHLSRIAVAAGDRVNKGDVIGYSGGARGAPGAGNSQGPHVHHEVRVNGRPVNPIGRYAVDQGRVEDRAAALAKQEEAARRKVLGDDTAFHEEQRSLRHKLLEATRKTTASESQRDQLLRDDINAEAAALKVKIANEFSAGKITQAQAISLAILGEANRQQRLQNVDIERASATVRQQADQRVASLDEQIAMAQLEADMVTTARERRAVELRILDLQTAREKQINQAIIDDQTASKAAQEAAERRNKAIDRSLPTQRRQIEQRTATPAEEHRERLRRAVGGANEINESLEGVAVDGLQNLEDGLTGIITGTESVSSAFKKMANQIIADLVRIAVQKLIFNSITGSLFGFADGGEVKAYATGGLISGPGSGRSDSILARLSNGEFVVNAGATAKHRKLLEAINGNRVPGFANGGLVAPRLPAMRAGGAGAGGAAGPALAVTINAPGATAETVARIRQEIAAAAPALISAATASTTRQLNRRRL